MASLLLNVLKRVVLGGDRDGPAPAGDREQLPEFGSLKLKRCRYGWMLFDGPFIGKCFELYGEYSESEVALMRGYVREGDTALDIGANIGDLTLPLARMAGPAGLVYSIESHARAFNVMCANLALNEIDNVKPLNAFVGRRKASAGSGLEAARGLSTQWGGLSYVSEKLPPPMLPIDELELPHCRLIKIDVDGSELDILQSARQTIERCRPVLYFENDSPANSPALIRHCWDQGYDLYWHLAPICGPDNFSNNPVNAWAPVNVLSLMVLGLPRESGLAAPVELARIAAADEWPMQEAEDAARHLAETVQVDT